MTIWRTIMTLRQIEIHLLKGTLLTGALLSPPQILEGWDMVRTTRAVTYTDADHVFTKYTHRGAYEYFRLPLSALAHPYLFVAVASERCQRTKEDQQP